MFGPEAQVIGLSLEGLSRGENHLAAFMAKSLVRGKHKFTVRITDLILFYIDSSTTAKIWAREQSHRHNDNSTIRGRRSNLFFIV